MAQAFVYFIHDVCIFLCYFFSRISCESLFLCGKIQVREKAKGEGG